MSFNLMMEGSSVKLFRSAILNLYKINCDTIGLQIFCTKVFLKSVDEAEAGMMVVELPLTFFSSFTVNIPATASATQSQTQSQEIEFVVSIRDILVVLRNKKVVKLNISRRENEVHRIKFTTTVSPENVGSEQTRSYFVKLLDGTEIQNIEVDLNSYLTCVVVQTAEIQRLLNYFRSNGEVCIILDQNNKAMPVGLMDYTSPAQVLTNMKIQRSMLVTDAEQTFRFVWHKGGASEGTFVVSHFKALMTLCGELMCNMKIFVGEPGQMMVVIPEPVEPHQEVAFGACIYLATLEISLAEKMKPMIQQQLQQQQRGTATTSVPNTEVLTPANVLMTPHEMLGQENATHSSRIPETPHPTLHNHHTNQIGSGGFEGGVPSSQ